jgi:hypothetical protein
VQGRIGREARLETKSELQKAIHNMVEQLNEQSEQLV